MGQLFDDLRYGVRILVKHPGFTCVAVLTLALGIGANTAVFSIVNAALLRPRPGISAPEQLASFFRTQKGAMFDSMGYPDYSDFRDRNRSFSGVAAHCNAVFSVSNGTAERLRGDVVTDNYFAVLGVKPALGRLLSPTDLQAAVLSYGLWQRKFGGDPGAVGTRISLNGYPFTIVGIAQREFSGTVTGDSFEVWVPLAARKQAMPRLSDGIMEERSAGWLDVFGRLKPGVRFEQADAEIKTIAGQLAQAYPLSNTGRSVNLLHGVGWYPDDRVEVGGLLRLLSAAVALVLLVSCANVAGLLMVRAASRRREIAVRTAVGASRGRLIRQLLTEGTLLSLIGGCLGLFLAVQTTQVLKFRSLDAGTDRSVLGFTLLASLVTGLLFALLPALRSLQLDLTSALKDGTAGAGQRRSRLQPALVVGQVALSFILLTGAGLLLRNLYRIVTADPGFETRNLAMMSLDLVIQQYSQERGEALHRQLLESLPAIPGVVSASLSGSVPPTEWPGRVPIFYPGEDPPQDILRGRGFDVGLWVEINLVSTNYFQTLGIHLLQGRDFTKLDRAGAPGVAIISQKLAGRMWPGQNPIGKRISYPSVYGPPRAPLEVIGVAADLRSHSLITDAPLLMYLPLLQNYDGRIKMVVRTASDPRAAIAGMERVLGNIDKDLPTFAAETMSEHIAASLWQQRMAAGWIGGFSFMGLVLAAIGLYGVIAQSVAQRTREVGIRVALGAAPGSISTLIVKEGMVLTLLGLALGMPIALASASFLRGWLSGLSARDPVSLAAATLLLVGVMLAACWIPARRASRVDPIEALRCE